MPEGSPAVFAQGGGHRKQRWEEYSCTAQPFLLRPQKSQQCCYQRTGIELGHVPRQNNSQGCLENGHWQRHVNTRVGQLPIR